MADCSCNFPWDCNFLNDKKELVIIRSPAVHIKIVVSEVLNRRLLYVKQRQYNLLV